MAATVAAPANQMVLQGVARSTYQSLVRGLEAQSEKRLTYHHGTLEIMVSLPRTKATKS
ncbi:MAG: hypothetical protein ICV62_02925 [Cyanobacteria bacterium Co-bin13]|nr:hypothetical protein [Cyanobacteria bacterium Co-bin13]